MIRDDIQKLLGGYATGTLTPEEQRALFAAALEDQELFDALAGEQALRDLLRDPAARARLLASLDEPPEPWWRRAGRWLPRPAAAGAIAAVCVAAVVGYGVWHARQTGRPVLVAANRETHVAPVQAAPSASPSAEPAAATGDVERRPNTAAAPSKPAPPARAPEMDAAPEPQPSLAAPSAPRLATLDKAGNGVAGMENQASGPGPAFARIASPPAPAPRDFARALSPLKPAPIKKDAKDMSGDAAKPAVVNGAVSSGIGGQQSEAPSAPLQAAAAAAQGVIALDGKGAAGAADQVAGSGAARGGIGPAPANRRDQLKAPVPSTSESVTVTAGTALLETQAETKSQSINGRQAADLPAGQAQTMEMVAISMPEVKWSALRRGPDGRLSPVEPDGIRAGDAIVLRLEPYADGTLSVAENLPGTAAPRVLMADTRVKRAHPVDTPAVTLGHPGIQELLVRFTANKAAAKAAAAPRANRNSAAPPAQTIVLHYR